MEGQLLDRLEEAAEKLLEKNRALRENCRRLEAEKNAWSQERQELLKKVDDMLARLDRHLQEEDS